MLKFIIKNFQFIIPINQIIKTLEPNINQIFIKNPSSPKTKWVTHVKETPNSTTKQKFQQQKHQITSLQFKRFNNKHFLKRTTISNRFVHQIQKLKSDQNNLYRLILPVQGERQELKTVFCKFLFSYADMQMTEQYQFKLDDMTRFPIIDTFQSDNIINPQIYHKITTAYGKRAILKYYNFRSFSDYQFKKCLYQLSIYQSLQSNNPLLSHFIIYKGQIKQLVMIFKYSSVSLHDILMYRRKANFQWEQKQILYIIKMLLEEYKILYRNGIVHRDIRPSNIFFTYLGVNNMGKPKDKHFDNDLNAFQQNRHNDRFYELINLSSARFYDNDGISGTDDNSDLVTIKGVPSFCDKKIRQALQNQNHQMIYNPLQIDFAGIKNTILSLINLQPTNIQKDSQVYFKTKPKIKQFINYMNNNSHLLNLQNLDIYISSLLGISSTQKTKHYYSELNQFYLRQLTICQNIQLNLYFNSPYDNQTNSQISSQSNGSNIMNSAGSHLTGSTNLNQSVHNSVNNSIHNSISQNFNNMIDKNQMNSSSYNVNKPPFYATVRDYIQNLYVKTLYQLQKKDVFVPYMLQKLAKNYQTNKRYQNVKLLMQVGNYFEDSGVRENQYYKEAISLLLQLAQEERIEGFFKDHDRYVNQVQIVFKKFQNQDSKAISCIKSKILKEKAYRQFYDQSNLRNTISNQIQLNKMYVPYESDRGRLIRKYIDQAILLGQRSNINFQEQLQLLNSKAQLALLMQNLDESEAIFQKGYQIVDKNFKQFKTTHDNNKYKGIFQYGVAIVQLENIINKRLQKKAKFIFNIQQKLQRAKQRFGMVNIHPIYLIKCYVGLGDLSFVKEDVQNSKQMYQRAINLIHAQNSKQQQNDRAVSAKIELDIVQKLINVLLRSNYDNQSKKYQKLRDALKKQIGRSRKDQKKYSRSGRQRNSTRNSTKQSLKYSQKDHKQDMKHSKLPIIAQQQQENRVYESHKMSISKHLYKSIQQNSVPGGDLGNNNMQLNTIPVGGLGYNNMQMESSTLNNNPKINSTYNNSPTSNLPYSINAPMGNSTYNNLMGNLGYNNFMGNSTNPMNTTSYNPMPMGGFDYNSPGNQYSIDPNMLTPPQNGFNQQLGSNLLNLFKSTNPTSPGLNNQMNRQGEQNLPNGKMDKISEIDYSLNEQEQNNSAHSRDTLKNLKVEDNFVPRTDSFDF